jgi:hypothetical protein
MLLAVGHKTRGRWRGEIGREGERGKERRKKKMRDEQATSTTSTMKK